MKSSSPQSSCCEKCIYELKTIHSPLRCKDNACPCHQKPVEKCESPGCACYCHILPAKVEQPKFAVSQVGDEPPVVTHYETATPEQKGEIMKEVAREANAEQREMMQPQPEKWEEEFDEMFSSRLNPPLPSGNSSMRIGIKSFIRRLLINKYNQGYEEGMQQMRKASD